MVKSIKVESLKNWQRKRKKWEKDHPVLYKLERIYYTIIRFFDKIADIPNQIKWFIQRGKRGWADCDTWGFADYLSEVIRDGLLHLKRINHSYPNELTEGKWIDIMNEIIYTFEVAHDIAYNDVIYIPSKEWSQEKYDEYKKAGLYPLRKENVLRYEKGWTLFQKYFFSLWD